LAQVIDRMVINRGLNFSLYISLNSLMHRVNSEACLTTSVLCWLQCQN